MRNLPPKAKLFVLLVYACGLLTVAWALIARLPFGAAPRWELAAFVLLGAFFGGKKIQLLPQTMPEDSGSLSLGFALSFAAMLRFGPSAALIVGATSALSGTLFPRPQPPHQLLFNLSLMATQSWMSGLTFLSMNGGSLALKTLTSWPAIIVSSLVYFLINTGGVATIIALVTDQPVFRLWRRSFLWSSVTYVAGATFPALIILLYSADSTARNPMVTMVLFGFPIVPLVYGFYRASAQREIEKQMHIEELQAKNKQLVELYRATIKSLALAIDAKDQYTHQHIIRVQKYAVATAKRLGLSEEELDALETGALLHDIGKLGVPEYVLLKPGKLTDEEFAKIKKHPEIGAAILDPVEFPWPVLPIVKYHHEKWDGTGYPEGLKGEAIPLTARILAVGDVYDALTSHRSYRNAWSHQKAIEVIKQGRGTHFDPVILDAFLDVIDDVVEEMAKEGAGPLALHMAPPQPSKADEAARDIQRASSELWALYEVAQTLSTSLGLNETLEILGRKLHAIMPGTACVFMIRDEASSHLVVRTTVGINGDFFAGGRTSSPHCMTMRVAATRETFVGEYDPEDLLLNGSKHTEWIPLHSALIVPIVHQGEVLGTINLYHPDAVAFGQHDRQFLEMVSERASLALYNGLLFDRTRSHAFTDPLTGLYNLRYLTQYVDERCSADSEAGKHHETPYSPTSLLARRRSDAFALLCLDLDSFKPINDNFGHQRGDQVLRDVSRIFLSIVRDTDIVARYGGDEFIIVLQGAGAAEAEMMARRLQDAVERYEPGLVHPRLGPLHLGVSAGYACYPVDGTDCATLLAAADTKMYADKTERELERLASRTPSSLRVFVSDFSERS